MSSLGAIIGGYTQNNLCDEIDPWLDILEHFNAGVTDDEVWQIAREYKQFPLIENIFQSLVINRLEGVFLEQVGCDWEDVIFESDVNSFCTSFSINGTLIMKESDFYDKIEEVKALLH